MKIVTKTNENGYTSYNLKKNDGTLLYNEYQSFIEKIGNFFIVSNGYCYLIMDDNCKDAFNGGDILTQWRQAFAFANKYIVVSYNDFSMDWEKTPKLMNILRLDGTKVLSENVENIDCTNDRKYLIISDSTKENLFRDSVNILNKDLDKVLKFNATCIYYIDEEKDLFNVQTESGWQVYNNQGVLVFPKNKNEFLNCPISYIKENDTFLVTFMGHKHYIYDNNFQLLLNGISFENIFCNFSEGFYTVKINGKWNFVDMDGNFLIKDETLNIVHAHSFHNGYAMIYIVDENDKYYANLIDRKGNFIVKSKEFTDFRTFKGCTESEFFIGCKRLENGGFTKCVYYKGSEELYSNDISFLYK